MSLITVLALIVAALLVGLACQLVGHSRESYEWEIGAVGALYGALLANGLLAPLFGVGLGLDGLPLVDLMAGAVTGGLLVLAFRSFGSPFSAKRRAVAETEQPAYSRLVTLRFSPELIEDPIVSQMRTRLGVSTRFDSAEVTGSRGWIRLQISGPEPAVEAALDLARQSRVQVDSTNEEQAPALLAA